MTEDQGQLPPGNEKRKHRREWEETHEILSETYLKFLTGKQEGYPNPTMKQPTIAQLSTITGFSTRTVERHLQELDRDINMGRRVRKYRLGSDIIMKSWLKAAVKGNVAAGEKYLQVAEQINFGNIVKVDNNFGVELPNLKALSKEDLAAYKALMKKMAGKGTAGGAPKPAS